MNWLDIAILAVLIISTLFSVVRGFAKDAISLAAWVLAFVIAITFADKFALILPQSIEQPQLRLGISVAILFIATLVMGVVANFVLAGFINLAHLRSVDRGLGALFGIFRGVAIIAILVVLGAFIGFQQVAWWQESMLIPYIENLIETVLPFLPESIAQYIKNDG